MLYDNNQVVKGEWNAQDFHYISLDPSIPERIQLIPSNHHGIQLIMLILSTPVDIIPFNSINTPLLDRFAVVPFNFILNAIHSVEVHKFISFHSFSL